MSVCPSTRCLTALPGHVLQHHTVQLFFTASRPRSPSIPPLPSSPPAAPVTPPCPFTSSSGMSLALLALQNKILLLIAFIENEKVTNLSAFVVHRFNLVFLNLSIVYLLYCATTVRFLYICLSIYLSIHRIYICINPCTMSICRSFCSIYHLSNQSV